MKASKATLLRNERENQQLLSILEEEGVLDEIHFIYRTSASFFRHYFFSPSSLGIRRFSDFLLQHERRLFDLPFCQECFLFVADRFNYSMERLEGIIYRQLERKPRPKEIYSFINRTHNQVKVYYFDEFRQVVYHHKLAEGTFPLVHNFDRLSYVKISYFELAGLLNNPKKRACQGRKFI